MTSKILTVLLLSANLAVADDAPPGDAVDAAIASEHEASIRERYNAQLTTIAERDIVTAQIIRDMSVKQLNAALREHRPSDADRWAKRHEEALRDENDARIRAAHHARERDKARGDFEASADRVRRLSRRASS